MWLASALYVGPFVDRGWIPHDEGLIGQSAERVDKGQLPHRDFDEVYTGGLDYVHRAAFKIGGVKLLSLRRTLFGFFLLWVPVVFWIASQFARPVGAALTTATAVVWSVPNYFASMPSWYNLFLATFGVATLLRFLDTQQTRWLVAAGLAGGLSFLVKSAGAYYIAGALIFLVMHEVSGTKDRQTTDVATDTKLNHLRVFVVLKGALAAVIVVVVSRLVRTHSGPMPILHFVVPIAAVSLSLVWTEMTWGEGRALRPRLRRLFLLFLPFVVGVALPIAAFLLAYERSDAISDFYRGVFLTPRQRLMAVSAELPPFATFLPAIPYVAVLLMGMRARRSKLERGIAAAVAASASLLLLLSGRTFEYSMLWNLGRHLNIAAVVAGCLVAARIGAGAWSPRPSERDDRTTLAREEAAQRILLLASVTAFSGLIEFPFAAPIYFCYVAPLVALTLGALVASAPAISKRAHVVVAVSLASFAIIRLNPGYVFNLGVQPGRYDVVSSDLSRIGLRIEPGQREDYRKLVGLIYGHAAGRYVYATPDCPEVYFVSGFDNPTRTFYETFNRRPMTSRDVMQLIEDRQITVVVINRTPEFSGPLSSEIESALAARFPQSDTAGRYLVRWGT